MASPLKVGLVGANAEGRGWAPLAHIPALKSLPQYELAAVCTAHADTAAASAEKYGVARAFHDVNDLVREPDIDVVSAVVKVPNHRNVVVAALNAGKHVFCEWPIGANLAETEEIAALARAKGVRTIVGLQGRADPSLNYVRDLVADGYAGELLAVTMTLFTGGVHERPAGRIWGREASNACHTVDALCYAVGEFAEVSAKVTTQVKQWKETESGSMFAVDAPDNVLISGVLENGAVASVHVAAVPYNASGWRMEVYGRDGTIVAATNGMPQITALTVMGSQGGAPLAELSVPEHYTVVPPAMPKGAPRNIGQLYVRFADAIENGTKVEPDFDDALARHRTVDAIQRASDEGRTIKLG
jgi:predicted dehydrogenase